MFKLHLHNLLFVSFLLCSLSQQTLALPPIAPPQRSPLNLPPFSDPNDSSPLHIDKHLPPILEIQGEEIVTLKQIQFRGNKALSTEELDQVVSQYLGRNLSIQEILSIREVISRYYAQKGYSLSSTLILLADNQRLDPKNAVISIRCIEGKVDQIAIEGTSRLNSFIMHQLQSALSPAVHEPRLISALTALRANPAIQDIKAQIGSLGELGHYTLTLKVKPEVPVNAVLLTSNDGTITTGTLSQTAVISVLSPLSWGDQLQVAYRWTEGSDTWISQYQMPINAKGGLVSLSFSREKSRIIPPPFNILDIRTREQNYDLTLRQPIFRSFQDQHQREIALGLGISHTRNQGELLGFPFPIVLGANDNGVAQATVLSLNQEIADRTLHHNLVARSALKIGIPISATISPNPPNGEFVAWAGQVSYQQRLHKSLTLSLRTAFQWVDRPVFSFEKFNLTGIDAVRGYPQNSLIQDNGWVLNTELNGRIYSGKAGELTFTPFFDLGIPWAATPPQILPSTDPNLLASVGLGLQYRFRHYLNLGLTWGVPLYPVKTFSHTLQEQGLSFSFQCKFP